MSIHPHALSRIALARDEVRAALGDDEDARAFWDTLAMLSDVEEIADRLLAEMSDAKAMAGALSTQIADMKARLTRMNQRAERAKLTLAVVLRATGERRMERPRATLSFSKGQKVVVLAPDFECPTQMRKRVPVPPLPEPDLEAIRAAIEANPDALTGASLERAPDTFTVRTR